MLVRRAYPSIVTGQFAVFCPSAGQEHRVAALAPEARLRGVT